MKKGVDIKILNPTYLGKISTVFQLICLVILFTSHFIETLPYELIRLVIMITFFLTIASGFHYLLIFKRIKNLVENKL